MGKANGFLIYDRVDKKALEPLKRIENFNEFHKALPTEEQKKQGARCMSCGVPFCQSGDDLMGMTSGCPLHNLVPEWNDFVFRGSMDNAYKRLVKTNNFPEFTARVCPALCENACTCGLDGDAVATKSNEYAIIETAFKKGEVVANPPKVRTGKRVAVVGSGPAGLAAADQLNKRGHSVTVFEREDNVGGLLRYGIPNMKLEKSVIDRRVDLLKAEGIEFVTNCNVGKGKKADELLKNFDKVILACGASNPRDIKVEGRDANGIYFAVDFLKSTTKVLVKGKPTEGKYISAKGKKVMVIGGGDTGNDCVGTSIRHGATSVIQLEMMPKAPDERAEDNPWPQWPKISKIDYGQEESIAVFGTDPRVYQTTVKEFLKDKDGNVCGAKIVKLKFDKDEKTGRLNMSELENSEEIIEVDLVLIAAGFLGSEAYVTKAFKTETDQRSNVKTEAYTTSTENVYACGDMRRGQSLVVWAIREGREVAKKVDEDLMTYSNLQVQ